jgi:hypothetical protein
VGGKAGTSGTGVVLLDPELVYAETIVGSEGAYITDLIGETIGRVAELLGDDPGSWTMALGLPLNPVRRNRELLETAGLACALHTWGRLFCAEVLTVEEGSFPRVEPPRELVGRRFKGERRMNAPAPLLCRTRDHEQDAYSIALFLRDQIEADAA